MKLHLIRHGRMAGDPFVCPSRPVAGCLSPEGIAQAEALGRALLGERLDAAFSSPYGRALQTAELALTGRDIPLTVVPGLEEWTPSPSFRNASSTVFEAMQERDRERFAEETWKTEQGEGTFDVYARVIPPLLGALAGFGWHHRLGGWVADAGTEACGVAVFAHGGSLNVMLAFLLGVVPFPVGRFGFALTGVATLAFVERRGLHYPVLDLPARSLPKESVP
jgi:broad specificity phosphatase PhoE